MRLFILFTCCFLFLSAPLAAKDRLPAKPSKIDILDQKLAENAAMDRAKWAGNENSRGARSTGSNRKTFVNDPAYTRSEGPKVCRRAYSARAQGCAN
jgi:hypothetical protein